MREIRAARAIFIAKNSCVSSAAEMRRPRVARIGSEIVESCNESVGEILRAARRSVVSAGFNIVRVDFSKRVGGR